MRFLAGLAAALSLVLLSCAGALAGPAESRLLSSYQGNWRGAGDVTGAEPGSITCRLVVRNTGPSVVAYAGRCNYGGGGTSFRGAMTYNDAARRYEASTSAGGVDSVTVGRKQGGGLVFHTGGLETRYGTISTSLAFARDIQMAFELVDPRGRVTSANILFSRD